MLTATLPRMSRSESLCGRRAGLPVELTTFYTLQNAFTGEIAAHLLYDNEFDAKETARYWHGAGWRVSRVMLKGVV